mgnify:CR=1 FL=1
MPYEKIGKNEPVCIADEVPFEIPESWEWVRLGSIGDWGSGATPSRTTPEYYNGNIPWLKTGDLNDGYITHIPETITERALLETSVRLNPIGSVLIAMYGATIGKLGILQTPATTNQACCACIPFTGIYNEFLFYFLMSQKLAFIKRGEGGAQPNISKEKIVATLMPLPPKAEQKRIVEKLHILQPYIESYTLLEKEDIKLHHSFPEILKKSILQYAIQGKLVPQAPTDEPASVLLECIRAEKEHLIKSGKIKRDKHESVIFRRDNSYYERVDGIERCIDDEIPFEIPDSWEWVRLKNIVNVVSARRVHQSDWKESGVPFYRAREIAKLADDGYVDNELFISENLYNEFSKSGAPQSGDLMVTAVGTLGKVYIVQQTDKFYYKDASVICFMNFGKLNPEYLKLIMMSPFMVSAIKDHSTGTTVGTITLVTANEYLVPVPPFLEQTRIVAHFQKLNHLINACNM